MQVDLHIVPPYEVQAHLQSREIRYWRDKRGHEVDFVLARRKQTPAAIECKWSSADFEPVAMQAFRRNYPRGDNFVVAHDVERSYTKSYGELSVKFVGLADLIAKL